MKTGDRVKTLKNYADIVPVGLIGTIKTIEGHRIFVDYGKQSFPKSETVIMWADELELLTPFQELIKEVLDGVDA